MKQEIFLARLQQGEIVEITSDEWANFAHLFESWQSYDTGFAGELLLLRGPSGLVALEQPQEGKRVVRPLADEGAAQRFVQQRLEAYERMWDG